MVAALAASLLAGCSAAHRTVAPPSPSPSPSPSAAQVLQQLAATATTARYVATYSVVSSRAPRTHVTVFRIPGAIRVDLTSSGQTAVLIVAPRGAFSCTVSAGQRTCLAVAGPHRPLPALFDAGLQKVFTSYVLAFAEHPAQYQVRANGGTAARGTLPAGTCFYVRPLHSKPAPVATTGRYCLSTGGVVTLVAFESGRLVLASLSGPPRGSVFNPLASPVPLPS